jgi:hypothetical protein
LKPAQGHRQIVQIVPALSPPRTGVGDYALAVAEKLRAAHRIESSFLVCSPQWRPGECELPFEVEVLDERSPAGLVAALERMAGKNAPVLLQLSPYGYERNGFPLWLVRGLKKWQAGAPGRRLVTMFHELYAQGPPWTKAFWVSELQQAALRRILSTSSAALTNTRVFADVLERWSGRPSGGIRCLPTPSNIGEPRSVPPIASRRRRICVFGIAPGAASLPRLAAQRLNHVVRSWPIEEIAVAGYGPVLRTFESLGCRVVGLQDLAAEALGDVLADSVLGLSWYPAGVLGKSGVYAAYCAYGVPTVLVGEPARDRPSPDGIEPDTHYLYSAALGEVWPPELLQRVSDGGRAWYSQHTLADHARAIADCLA